MRYILVGVLLLGLATVPRVGAIDPEKGVRLEVKVRADGIGWIHGREGEMVGTTGQSRKLTGIQVQLAEAIPDLGLRFRLHVAGHGDTDWFHGGAECGDRIEGITIELTGPAAAKFNVFYQGHCEGVGDTAIFANGEFLGSRGLSRRLEALVIVIKPK